MGDQVPWRASQRPQHYCSVCNVTATSAVHLKTHFMGSKHQRRMSVLQSGHPQPRPQHYCEASCLKCPKYADY